MPPVALDRPPEWSPFARKIGSLRDVAYQAPASPAPLPTRPLPKGALITGIVLMVAALVLGAAAIVVGVVKVIGVAGSSARFSAPGSIDVSLNGGDQAIWSETADTSGLSSPKVTGPDGKTIVVRPYNSNTNTDITLDGIRYAPDYVFMVPAAGTYTVTVDGDAAGNKVSILVGPTPAAIATTVAVVFGLIALAFVLFVIGVILLIVGLVKRSRAKRAIAYPPPPGGYYPPPPVQPL